VLALVAAGIVVVATSGSGDPGRRIASGELEPGRLVVAAHAEPVSGARRVTHLVAASGSLWAAAAAPGRGAMLLRLDPASGAVRSRVALGGDAVGAAAGYGSLWVVTDGEGGRGELVRVDAQSGDVQATIALSTPEGVTTGAGAVWVTDPTRGELARVDPATNQVVGVATVPGAAAVAVAGGAVYVVERGSGVIADVDPVTLQVVKTVFVVADRLVSSGEGVWAISSASGTLLRFDGRAGPTGVAVTVGKSIAGATAAAQGALWVALGTRAGLGLLRPGATRLERVTHPRGLHATTLALTRAGLWMLDTRSPALTLLEAR
jgi:streptogramin lyase